MDYFELNMANFGDLDPEIAMAQLAEMGFESFMETETGILGFIREDEFNEGPVAEYLSQLSAGQGVTSGLRKVEARNWNAIWESAYEPVTIAGKCQVRAPFHTPVAEIRYDIVIEPKMSFGTAHHETTSLMLQLLLEEDIKGKRVLDMGCGTGVLAILAHKMDAGEVVAIDTDDWAFANALDNMEKNDASSVVVIQGDASSIPSQEYDLIIANINRNVLLADIPVYARFLNSGGALLVSGFYTRDLDQIREVSAQSGLQYMSHQVKNDWVGAKFIK